MLVPADFRAGVALRSDGDEAAPRPQEVAAEVAQVAARGHAFNSGLVNAQAAMLAIPLAINPPARPLALGVAAPKDLFRGRRPELLRIMRGALGRLGEPPRRLVAKTA